MILIVHGESRNSSHWCAIAGSPTTRLDPSIASGTPSGARTRISSSSSPRDLVSTANETISFMAAWVSRRVFDGPLTSRLMTGNFNPFAFSPTLRPLGPGRPIEYGLGMLRFRLPRMFTGFRQSPTLYGHTGATGSWLSHDPTADLILSATVDQVTSAPSPTRSCPASCANSSPWASAGRELHKVLRGDYSDLWPAPRAPQGSSTIRTEKRVRWRSCTRRRIPWS